MKNLLVSLSLSHLGDIGGDGVEDVDEDEEDGDEEGHPAGDDGGRDQEGDPRDDDEHARGEVVGDDVVGDLAAEGQLKAGHRVVAYERGQKKLCIFENTIVFLAHGFHPGSSSNSFCLLLPLSLSFPLYG